MYELIIISNADNQFCDYRLTSLIESHNQLHATMSELSLSDHGVYVCMFPILQS